ncbi:MAG: hypothetical protein M3Z26_05410 [Bacteroidota bacterium]|nr:hypothetical protein [Bacteroidota bacterium]
MNTFFDINPGWMYFCIVFGAMLLISFIMNQQSKKFYTLHVFMRKFSMIDLESPASPLELATYINGIFKLPQDLSKKCLNALKGNIYLSFLFAPLAYGSVFLLCIKISMQLTSVGHYLFAILAWVQIIPLLCDIIEKIYLLKKIHPDVDPSQLSIHVAYQIIGIIKWSFTLIAIVLCISTIFYFWITGKFSDNSIHYLLITIGEIILFFILKKATSKIGNVNLRSYQNICN